MLRAWLWRRWCHVGGITVARIKQSSLPDNLTRYRIMAFAVDAGRSSGTGNTSFKVDLPRPRDRASDPFAHIRSEVLEDLTEEVLKGAAQMDKPGEGP